MIAGKGQRKAVKDYLWKGETLTSYEAFKLFGCTRLSAIIFELRKSGYDIETFMIKRKNRYGETSVYAEYGIRGRM